MLIAVPQNLGVSLTASRHTTSLHQANQPKPKLRYSGGVALNAQVSRPEQQLNWKLASRPYQTANFRTARNCDAASIAVPRCMSARPEILQFQP
jgi:hypothetical protein